MNILRWKRKSKKKINFRTLVLLIFSLIMTTFAWFAYSKVLEPSLNIHMASWDMEYKINGETKANPISINMPLYPTMSEETVIVDIFNNGETLVDIDHHVKSLTIAGIRYEAIHEGETPETERYITIAPAKETTITKEIEVPVPDTDTEDGGETEQETPETPEVPETPDEPETNIITVTEQVFKGSIINDITKFPFTIDIEYSAQVKPVSVTDYGVKVPGQGYLKITVNWLGDNNALDSEWGYLVGEHLENNPDSSAMLIELSIDSYQADPKATPVLETTMPSTSTTKPYLPEGFSRVKGTTLQSGLVIEDSKGNQYVWVEVPKSKSVYQNAGIGITDFTEDTVDEGGNVTAQGTYSKIENDLRNYVSEYNTRPDKFLYYDATGLSKDSYPKLKNKVLKSIYQHGGFYIGRYETGLEGEPRTKATSTTPSAVPVIKPNVYPYNWVTCEQANTIASRLQQTGYTTSLMFGLQWDLVLKYIQEKGSLMSEMLKTDSTLYGNYQNNSYVLINPTAKHNQSTTGWLETIPYEKIEDTQVLVTPGANSTFCMQNIYDLAGNLSEWTYNIVKDEVTGKYVGGNGGNYLINGDEQPAISYGTYNTMAGAKEIGFRISLISEADVNTAWGDNN